MRLINLANKSFNKKKYKKAIFLYSLSHLISKNCVYCLEKRAEAYSKLKNYSKALEDLTALIAFNPNCASYYAERGTIKLNLNFKSSVDDFSKAIELEPETAYYYSCRAMAHERNESNDLAFKDHEKAMELDPQNSITVNNYEVASFKNFSSNKIDYFYQELQEILTESNISTDLLKVEPSPQKYHLNKNSLLKEFWHILKSPKEIKNILKEIFFKR